VNRAIFIDRDGTIAKDVPYCSRPEDFQLLTMAGDGIRLLNKTGTKVIVITNQSGIARGYFTTAMLGRIHSKMRSDLAQYQAHIDAIYYCPHHPDDQCDCRKPKPALIYRAAKEHDIQLSQSFFVGNQWHDVAAGHSAGCKTCLISPDGTSGMLLNQHGIVEPDFIARDFFEACMWILGCIKLETIGGRQC
jgi:D,D-heptose 1,7-bisphosphate phosphatase